MQATPGTIAVLDRLLHHVAAALGAIDNSGLALKGGTLLRVCALDDHRYSEDLDFDFVGTPERFREIVAAAAQAAATTSSVTLTPRPATTSIYLDWEDGEYGGSIKVEATFLAEAIAEVQEWPIFRRDDDLPHDATIAGYTLTDVLCDKLKAVARRGAARDIYDIAALLNAGADLDAAWRRYLEGYDDQRREYGGRNHPSDIRTGYLPKRAAISQRWEEMRTEGWLPSGADFEVTFAAVDARIAGALSTWKSSLGRGELARQKAEHQQRRRARSATDLRPGGPEGSTSLDLPHGPGGSSPGS